MGAANSVPYEIIGAPFKVWRAAVGVTFPLVDAEPDGSDFTLIGTSGDLNYGDEGVKVGHPQSFNKFRPLGDNGPRKIFRTEEDLIISLMLADVSLEQYRRGLNDNSLTTVAAGGEAGYKKVGLTRGLSVATMALLVRGPSPYGDDMYLQYEVPICVQTGSPEVTYTRTGAAMLSLEWSALVDPNASSVAERFGVLRAMTAVAIS